MKRNAVFLMLGVALLASGCDRSGQSESGNDQPFVYSEATIDKFVTACLQRSQVSVAQCACVLERSRAEMPEGEFVKVIANASPDPRMAAIFGQCELNPGGSFAAAMSPSTATPDASSAVATSGGSAAMPPQAVSPAQPPATVVRAATTGEACVQEKLAAAQAKSGGQSVSLDVYDKIRAECGS